MSLTGADMLNQIAWRDFILWAVGDPDVRAHFQRDTGSELAGPTQEFVDWATVTLWGLEDAPLSFQSEYAQRKAA